jgi:hypothetical protein
MLPRVSTVLLISAFVQLLILCAKGPEVDTSEEEEEAYILRNICIYMCVCVCVCVCVKRERERARDRETTDKSMLHCSAR